MVLYIFIIYKYLFSYAPFTFSEFTEPLGLPKRFQKPIECELTFQVRKLQ